MDVAGPTLVPLNVFISHFILYGNFLLIRDWAYLDVFTIFPIIGWGGGGGIVWLAVLHLGGAFNEKSRKAIKSWKVFGRGFGNGTEARYLRKFANGCKPLFIGCRGYYVIRKLTVLKFLKSVVRGTFRMLLTLRK